MMITQVRTALAMLSRPEGATAKELQTVLRHKRYDDSAIAMREYLLQYSNLSLVARRMSPEDRQQRRYRGPGKIYHVRLRETA